MPPDASPATIPVARAVALRARARENVLLAGKGAPMSKASAQGLARAGAPRDRSSPPGMLMMVRVSAVFIPFFLPLAGGYGCVLTVALGMLRRTA